MVVELGRELCGDLRTATAREWLVTNGIGGFAAGTVSGVLSRRYHGLLVAALKPPLGRTLLVSHVDETAELSGQRYPLGTSRWQSGAVTGHGHRNIERFVLDGRIPTWTYALGDALLEKRVFMAPERNTTYVQYSLRRGSVSGVPVALRCKVLVNYRDYHGETRSQDWLMRLSHQPGGDTLRITAYEGASPFLLRTPDGNVTPEHSWYRDYQLEHEQERGFPGTEDHLCVGEFSLSLREGETRCLFASCEPDDSIEANSELVLALLRRRDARLLAQASRPDDPPGVAQLILATSDFMVQRDVPRVPLPAGSDHEQAAAPVRAQANRLVEPGISIIAGYPWFSDWGRDSMISLPGLLLATGRTAQARMLLRTYLHFLDRGLIPNRFPDEHSQPEYNTADATLWLVESLRAYVAGTDDDTLLHEVWPALREIVAWHERGTRHGITWDPDDGLLRAGEPGIQVTWMDAKVGDWVVTPRIGKPVEINALWYNALCVLSRLAARIGYAQEATWYAERARRTQQGFARFVCAEKGQLFDVIDGPSGHDASLRPNQIFAVSLPHSPLSPEQQRIVVDICARELYTSRGLRSLARGEPAYIGQYVGDMRSRDGAYHQGTVWGWLLGPFARAHYRVYGDADKARSFLLPMLDHLDDAGLGQISEIFDGNPPFLPRGCFAQAWSVAEWLAAFRQLESPTRPRPDPQEPEEQQAQR